MMPPAAPPRGRKKNTGGPKRPNNVSVSLPRNLVAWCREYAESKSEQGVDNLKAPWTIRKAIAFFRRHVENERAAGRDA